MTTSAATTGAVIVRAMLVEPVRACASAMLTGSVFAPAVTLAGTVAMYVNVRSAATTSPWVPSSKKACVDEPPIELRSAVTVSPVLAGFVPGVTATVSVVADSTSTDEGVAVPTPDGLVGVGPPPQALNAEAVFRGVGVLAVKSAELMSVSVQPLEMRVADVVPDSVGAAAGPSKKFALP